MNKIVSTLMMSIVLFAGCTVAQKTSAPTGTTPNKKSDNTLLTAITDEAVGGASGVVISQKMNVLAKQMEADLGKTVLVERIGEGIKLTFNTQLLFDVGQTNLKETNKADLLKFAKTLIEHPQTDMLIVGHTDDVGDDESNRILSEKRANAVANHLIDAGVDIKRMLIQSWGETQPTVLNNSEANRSQNRRVEIAVYANDQMKLEAKKEAGQ